MRQWCSIEKGHRLIDQFTSDQEGWVRITGLTAGEYYLRELEPADGYLADNGTPPKIAIAMPRQPLFLQE